MMFHGLGECDINVPIRIEHSIVTYLRYLDQFQVSAFPLYPRHQEAPLTKTESSTNFNLWVKKKCFKGSLTMSIQQNIHSKLPPRVHDLFKYMNVSRSVLPDMYFSHGADLKLNQQAIDYPPKQLYHNRTSRHILPDRYVVWSIHSWVGGPFMTLLPQSLE